LDSDEVSTLQSVLSITGRPAVPASTFAI
jgi:hypothetical protein